MAASELALAGVDTLVVERRWERVRNSRALTLHPRSLELMAMRGIADRFLARGQTLPTGHYANLETRLRFDALETDYPFTLLIPQFVTEELLEQRARALGAAIWRGHEVTGLTQDAQAVHVHSHTRDGAILLEARYVRSSTRSISICLQMCRSRLKSCRAGSNGLPARRSAFVPPSGCPDTAMPIGKRKYTGLAGYFSLAMRPISISRLEGKA